MKNLLRKYMLVCTVACLAAALSACGETKWNPSITTETIVIPGLTREYDFLFVTDTHMIVQDDSDTQKITEIATPRHRDFKNAEGIPSAEQFPEWIRYANENELDGLLLGGDIIDYPSKPNVNYLEKQLEDLKVPYLYALGNHDWTYPWEYMTEYGEDTYLPMLEPYMKGDSAIHTIDCGEFVIVAIDNSNNQVNEEALQGYQQVLDQGKPVIVLAHVPFLTQSVLSKAKVIWKSGVVIGGGNFGGIYPDAGSQRFLDMTTAKDSPVEAVLAGHVHFADRDNIVGLRNVPQIVGDAGYKGRAVLLHITGNP